MVFYDRISSDGGLEFDNSLLKEKMKQLEVNWHFNTPGHPKRRGGIERLHSTLSNHLRVYNMDKGLEPDEAMIRAVAAYNSIHAVTGFSPFEILFGLQGGRRDFRETATTGENIIMNNAAMRKLWGKVQDRIEKEKCRQEARQNQNLRDIMGDLRLGNIVYWELGTNRDYMVIATAL
ncbi:uncharacterized protein [Halyomorpha halys]|uniref:uncharacterized protein n=1 Tax=Halyomorpha halys TaxID=286706 RepID=UPI0034D18B20